MSKAFSSFALTTLLVARIALAATKAKDDDAAPPPPPPPPPPADTTTSDSSSSSDSGGSTFKRQDALLDATTGKHRPMMLSFFLGIPYGDIYGCYYSCGFPLDLDARFDIPIVHDGFVPQINDSLSIEFGVDLGLRAGYYGGPFQLTLLVEPRYNVYLLPNLTVYLKPLDIGFWVWPGDTTYHNAVGFHYDAAVGVVYKLNPSIYLRAELGTYAIKGGIGIAF
jgi:hypothetical protein